MMQARITLCLGQSNGHSMFHVIVIVMLPLYSAMLLYVSRLWGSLATRAIRRHSSSTHTPEWSSPAHRAGAPSRMLREFSTSRNQLPRLLAPHETAWTLTPIRTCSLAEHESE
jgi:hypothetical protein